MESYLPGTARTLALPPSRVRAAQPLPARQPRAIERPAVHLHFHGMPAEEMAAIIRRYLP
jgi:hypothetical protein